MISLGVRTEKAARIQQGTSMSEIPVVLFVFLICLLFPLIDLGVIAYRTSFVHSAAHTAVHSAARARTFLTNGANGELSAVNIAKRDAMAVKGSANGGVNFSEPDITITIIGTPIQLGKTEIRSTTPLAALDTKSHLYQMEVKVQAQIEPLVVLSDKLFGDVPGLTVPMPIQATYKQFCEHPAGLTK